MKRALTGWLSLLVLAAVAQAGDTVGSIPAPAAPAPAAPASGGTVFWHDGGLDKNGDGLISDDELADALAKRCATLRRTLAGEAFVSQYDLNKDGKLDAQEIDAACAKFEGKFRALVKELNQAAIHRFDKDGDGILNDAEKAELKKGVASICKAPAPHPGSLPRQNGQPAAAPTSTRPVAEEISLRGAELRRERDAILHERLQKFDQDGDGKLNAEEKAKARAAVLGKASD